MRGGARRPFVLVGAALAPLVAAAGPGEEVVERRAEVELDLVLERVEVVAVLGYPGGAEDVGILVRRRDRFEIEDRVPDAAEDAAGARERQGFVGSDLEGDSIELERWVEVRKAETLAALEADALGSTLARLATTDALGAERDEACAALASGEADEAELPAELAAVLVPLVESGSLRAGRDAVLGNFRSRFGFDLGPVLLALAHASAGGLEHDGTRLALARGAAAGELALRLDLAGALDVTEAVRASCERVRSPGDPELVVERALVRLELVGAGRSVPDARGRPAAWSVAGDARVEVGLVIEHDGLPLAIGATFRGSFASDGSVVASGAAARDGGGAREGSPAGREGPSAARAAQSERRSLGASSSSGRDAAW